MAFAYDALPMETRENQRGALGALHHFGHRAGLAAPAGSVLLAVAAVLSCFLFVPPANGQNVNVGTNIPGMPRGPGVSQTPPAPSAPSKQEEPALLLALATLDKETRMMGEGPAIWDALSAQAKVPVSTLKQQRSTTKWNYGDLLVGNSLAIGSGNSFKQIVTLRAGANGWSQLARKLRIDPALIAARATAVTASLKQTKTRGIQGSRRP